jgi:ribosomal protein L11 methyltransferase
MVYHKLSIKFPESEEREILIAELSELGAEGFEELPETLIVFVPAADYNREAFAAAIKTEWAEEEIAPKNWNAEWESNFDPVVVDDFCAVRAHFHRAFPEVQHEILITPKMSFGTGHHATTRLMMERMREIDFKDKTVFDFGTGTGVLAILAEKLGASTVLATDNDSWSIENALENCTTNACEKVRVSDIDIESIEQQNGFEIILANINRNILLQYMPTLFTLLRPGGMLLMSGLLTEDEAIIREAATAAGFTQGPMHSRNNWICILCGRN